MNLNSFKIQATVLGISLLLVACAATDVANRYYAPERYPPRPIDEVEILTSEPSKRYVVIADFQMRGESARGMQKRAAAIGADAVIITVLGGLYSGTEEWAGKDSYEAKIENKEIVGTYSRIVGTAIIYTENLGVKK